MQIVDYKAVWQKIKAKRQQCGMTQEQLAELSKYPPEQYEQPMRLVCLLIAHIEEL